MLERATRCLESRAPCHRRLSSHHPRRQLHVAFWHHAAADLPQYLDTVSRLFEPPHYTPGNNPRHSSVNDRHEFPCFLDFLYPPQTLALLRRWTTNRGSNRRYQRRVDPSNHTRTGPRSYASVAHNAVTHTEKHGTVAKRPAFPKELPRENPKITASSILSNEELQQSAVLRHTIQQFVESEDSLEYAQDIWKHYNELPTEALRKRLAADVFMALLRSERFTNVSRASRMFPSIPKNRLSEQLLSTALSHFLSAGQGQLATAALIHDSLMSLKSLKDHHFDSSTTLLVRLFQNQQWTELFTSYSARRAARGPSGISNDAHKQWRMELLGAIRTSPRYALSITTMLEFWVEKGGMGHLDAARSFVRTLVFPLIEEPNLPRFQAQAIELLQKLNLTTYTIAETAAMGIIDRNGPLDMAMRCYDAVIRDKHKPKRVLIGKLLQASVESDHSESVHKLAKDSEAFYGKLHVSTAVQMMTWYARQADVASCLEIIEQHRGRARALSHGFFYPILHAEAVRYGPATTEQRFGWIEENFALTPDLNFWNILLNAHARFDDIDGAQLAFGQMKDAGINPDEYTIGTLLGICGARGDVRLAQSFLRLASEEKIPRTASMDESLALAHINDGNVHRAIEMATQTAQEAPQKATRMWTQVLAALASRKQFRRGLEASQRMRELQVPFDSAAYAALMRLFTSEKQPHMALRVMSELMQKDRVAHSALHYAILINGYVDANKIESAYRAHAQWLLDKERLGLPESISSRLALLQMQGQAAKRQLKTHVIPGPRIEAMEELLEELLTAPNSMILADKQPQILLRDRTLPEAEPAAYFDVLFQLYEHTQAIEMTKLLLKMVRDNSMSTRPLEQWQWPVRVIYSIMKARQQIGDYATVTRLWDMVVPIVQQRYGSSPDLPDVEEQSPDAKEKLQEEVSSEETELSRMPAKARHLLARHLDIYLRSMVSSESMGTVSETLQNYEQLGFQLDNSNWNTYVRMLLSQGLVMQAFALAETKLMRGYGNYQLRYLWQLRKGADPKQTPVGQDRRKIRRGANFVVYSTLEYMGRVMTELHTSLDQDGAMGGDNQETTEGSSETDEGSFDVWGAVHGRLARLPREHRQQLLAALRSQAPESTRAIVEFPYPEALLPLDGAEDEPDAGEGADSGAEGADPTEYEEEYDEALAEEYSMEELLIRR